MKSRKQLKYYMFLLSKSNFGKRLAEREEGEEAKERDRKCKKKSRSHIASGALKPRNSREKARHKWKMENGKG